MLTKEMVLDTWWTGASRKETAELTGTPVARVNTIIAAARRRGDPRAARRTVKGRKDGRSHDSRGIYRSRAEVQSIRQFVLDSWAAGLTCKEIGKLLHLDEGYAYGFVERARAAGDPRAAYR